MLKNTVLLSFTDTEITTQYYCDIDYTNCNCKKVFGITKLIYTQIYMTKDNNMHILDKYSLHPLPTPPKKNKQTKTLIISSKRDNCINLKRNSNFLKFLSY